MSNDGPRKPTHDFCVRTPDGKRRGVIGSAWLNEDGSLNVHLNPGTVLDWRDNLQIGLFPKTQGWNKDKQSKSKKPEVDPDDPPFG